MSTRILFFTLLLLFMCSLSAANNGRLPTRRFPHPCCVKLSTADFSNDVTGDTYRKPPAKAPCVEAIVLTTSTHGQVCVDPKIEWVQTIIANMTKV